MRARQSKSSDEPDLFKLLVNAEVLGAFLGITLRQVTSLARDGVIPPAVSRGRYALAASVKAYVRHKATQSDDAACQSLTEERTKLTKSRAAIAEMQRRKLAGEVCTIAEVTSGWRAIVSVFRARALALPRRAAPIVAVMSKPSEAEQYLTGVVREMLETLASTKFVGVGARAGAGSGADDHADFVD